MLEAFRGLWEAALQSQCESCGRPFRCGANLGGCWCSQVPLDDDARQALRDRFSGCLCRECLEKLTRGTDLPHS